MDTMANNMTEIKLDSQNNAVEVNKPKQLELAEEFITNNQAIKQ